MIPEYASPIDEEHVLANAFDLIFAFDEVISMGHKENISLVQVLKVVAFLRSVILDQTKHRNGINARETA